MGRPATARSKSEQPSVDQITLLQQSPIHGIQPIGFEEISANLVEVDATNPGGDETSGRYKRRWEPISDSFDIIGSYVYPLIVSEHPEKPGRYLLVDGHGRFDEAARRRETRLRALVYPRLTLEQRICLRQTLNAAQEPFDTPLVLKDLHLLAEQRALDIRDEKQMRALLADLPANIRKHQEKLKRLAEWPREVADKIGIEDDDNAGVVGYDKIKELGLLVKKLRRNHPQSVNRYKGQKLHKQVLKLYFNGAFRGGRRSQDMIREVRSTLLSLPQEHTLVKKMVNGEINAADFISEAEGELIERGPKRDLVTLCRELNAVLTDLDPANLTAAERRSLKRTADNLSKVLAEIAEE